MIRFGLCDLEWLADEMEEVNDSLDETDVVLGKFYFVISSHLFASQ